MNAIDLKDIEFSKNGSKPTEKQATIEWLPVDNIQVDMEYQRFGSEGKIKDISSDFDEMAVGIPAVSLREDGQVFAIDGQHRIKAMRKKGISQVQCEVFHGLTIEEEARIYTRRNMSTKKPEAIDVFKARLVFRDPVVIRIKDVVEKCGLYIPFEQGYSHGQRPANSIWGVQSLEQIYKKGKEELLEYILRLAIQCWPDDPNALQANFLLGMTDFHLKYKGQYDRQDFIAKMNITDLNSLRRRAQYHRENNGGSMITSFSLSLRENYDKGKRSRRLKSN